MRARVSASLERKSFPMSHDRSLLVMRRLGIAALLLGSACRQEAPPEPSEVLSAAATIDDPTGFVDQQFVSGLNKPSQMAFTPDGRLFVAERGGTLRVVKNGSLLGTAFVTITVDTNSGAGERGLL